MHFLLLTLALVVTAIGFPLTHPHSDLSRLQTGPISDEEIDHPSITPRRMVAPGTYAPLPHNMDHLWEAMDKVNVSLGLQVDLQSIFRRYARDVVIDGHTPGGPSNGINNTAMAYLKRMTYGGLYNNFTREFMMSIVYLQKLAMEDVKSINVTRQFLEDLEFREKGWTSGLNQLSSEANWVIAWLNEYVIAEIDRIHEIRQIFEDAIKVNPDIGDQESKHHNFWGVRMDPESDWLVDYDHLPLHTEEGKQALRNNREKYDALMRSGLDRSNATLFEEKLMDVVSNYTLRENMPELD